ncbi:MAG: hypothetical protein Q4F53_09030 [Nesterenkonia sp.]|uniref:hypothetical protein n=1 Tax=Nesterenkonia marinintestina TaxID=2979865 RepID=UPI0021C0FBD7|nr:hypothetical protein [Nesterenkonia sp. GX14115]MDO5493737.1 hypothetical protein [Nesterenkonia sp.]
MTDAATAGGPTLTSTSRPGWGPFVLVGVLMLVSLGVGAAASLAVEGVRESRTALLVLAGVAVAEVVLMWWLHRHSTVTLTADARGITLHTMRFVRSTIPWQEVDSIAVGLRGPSLEIGWRMYGGGRVAYAAGPETITLTTTRTRGHRPAALQGHRLAREYLVSVSEAEAVVARLQQMRPR